MEKNKEQTQLLQQSPWFLDNQIHYIYLLTAIVLLFFIIIKDMGGILITLLIAIHLILLVLKFVANKILMKFFFGVHLDNFDVAEENIPRMFQSKKLYPNYKDRKIEEEYMEFPTQQERRTKINQIKPFMNYDQMNPRESMYVNMNSKTTKFYRPQERKSCYSSIGKRQINNGFHSQTQYSRYSKYQSKNDYPKNQYASRASYLNLQNSKEIDFNHIYDPQDIWKNIDINSKNLVIDHKTFSDLGISKERVIKMMIYLRERFETAFRKYKRQQEQTFKRIQKLCSDLFGTRLITNDSNFIINLKKIVPKLDRNEQVVASFKDRPKYIDKEYFKIKFQELKSLLKILNQSIFNPPNKSLLLECYKLEAQKMIPSITIKIVYLKQYIDGFDCKTSNAYFYQIAFDVSSEFSYCNRQQTNHLYNLEESILIVLLTARQKLSTYEKNGLSGLMKI